MRLRKSEGMIEKIGKIYASWGGNSFADNFLRDERVEIKLAKPTERTGVT